MRVLFIEDNEVNRRLVGAMLRAVGVEMDEAPDGPTGLQMISDHAYDLVLMDLRMPGMDGVTAIRHLRARPDAKAELPVIVVTADAGRDVEAECLAAGADGVLVKPVSMTALFGALGQFDGAPAS